MLLRVKTVLWAFGIAIVSAGPMVSGTAAVAQSVQPRGVIQPGKTLGPSAQQQLNQNLNRQQNNFSTQQRIDSNNRLNRTQQINRTNTRTNTLSSCPGANSACQN